MLTRVKDTYTENYLHEAFPGGFCLCISSKTPSAPALYTHQWPMVVSTAGTGAASSRSLPKYWTNFLPELNIRAKPQELLLDWEPCKPKQNWKSKNCVGIVRAVRSRQLFLAGTTSKPLLSWPGVLLPMKTAFSELKSWCIRDKQWGAIVQESGASLQLGCCSTLHISIFIPLAQDHRKQPRNRNRCITQKQGFQRATPASTGSPKCTRNDTWL